MTHPFVQLARQAIAAQFAGEKFTPPQEPELSWPRGVFVTLTIDDDLRGCIGFPEPTLPLGKAIVAAALGASFEDPRFGPLTQEEFARVTIEVTLLSEPEVLNVARPNEYLEKIKIGRDGLLLRRSFHSGLLLPQVPVEYGWNAETFLEQLCLKAGLPRDAWKDPETQIRTFQGTIYKE